MNTITEDQGKEIIDLLNKIHIELKSIKSNTNETYDNSHIISKIDEIVEIIKK